MRADPPCAFVQLTCGEEAKTLAEKFDGYDFRGNKVDASVDAGPN